MIGKLSGVIDYKTLDHVLIDVRGVGYIVYCSDRTLAALPGPGQAVALYTDMLVREDLMQLFGFPTLIEKEWHRLLMTVQGVGAKASLAILGALGSEGTGRAIALGDWNAIKVAKGIGPKTAQRVVIELKDKAPTLMAMTSMPAAAPGDDVLEEVSTVSAMPAPKAKPKAAPKADPNAGRCDGGRGAGRQRHTRPRHHCPDPCRAAPAGPERMTPARSTPCKAAPPTIIRPA